MPPDPRSIDDDFGRPMSRPGIAFDELNEQSKALTSGALATDDERDVEILFYLVRSKQMLRVGRSDLAGEWLDHALACVALE